MSKSVKAMWWAKSGKRGILSGGVRQALALLLVFALVVGLIPTPAFAEALAYEGDGQELTETVDEQGDQEQADEDVTSDSDDEADVLLQGESVTVSDEEFDDVEADDEDSDGLTMGDEESDDLAAVDEEPSVIEEAGDDYQLVVYSQDGDIVAMEDGTWEGSEYGEAELVGEAETYEPSSGGFLSPESTSTIYKVAVDNYVNYDAGYQLLGLVNAARSRVGARSLVWDRNLENYAILRATECSVLYYAANNTHYRPNGYGGAACIPYVTETGGGAENMGLTTDGSSLAYQFNNSWTKSRSHYTNMVDPGYTCFGAGIVRVGDYYYGVEIFRKGSSSSTARAGYGTAVSWWPDYIECTYDNLRFGTSPSSVNVTAGQTTTVRAMTGWNRSWNVTNMAPTKATALSWSSSNTSVATVSATSGNSSVVTIRGIAAGTATITGRHSSGKTCTVSVTVSAPSKVSLSGATISRPAAQTYTGSAITPLPTLTYGGRTLARNTDYTLSYSANTNAGTATVTATGKGAYTGTRSTTFTINKAPISYATITPPSDRTYTGRAVTSEPTLTYGGRTLREGTDYALSYANNVKAGSTATVTVTGKGNFSGSRYAYFAIVSKTTSIAGAQVTAPEQTYTGEALEPAPKVVLGGKTLTAGTDYIVTSYEDNEKPGTATVSVEGKGDYRGTATGSFKIVAKRPTWSGATRIPVGATAEYKVTNGGWICMKVNGNNVESDGVLETWSQDATSKIVRGWKAGTTTLYLFDGNGKQVDRKTITVYSIEGSDYEIQTAVSGKSNYVLDISGGSTANRARMIVWPRNNGKNQRYRFVPNYSYSTSGYVAYAIRCVHSGKHVDVQGGGTNKRQPVIQYMPKKTDCANQLWRITVDAYNRVTFVSLKSGMVIDIQGGKVTDRAQTIQYPCNNGNNQKWVLNRK